MAEGEQLVRVDGRRLRLTNLDKVLYPETGTTKGEVIDYYTRIAALLIPHASGRPVTRKRWPEGVDHPPFFAKDLERGAPSWVPRRPIDHSGGAKDYPLVEDVPTLVYLAQVASLELHVPQWRFTRHGDRANPDRLVLDLDPGPGTGLAECAEVARWAREILRGMGMDPVPVTSGSKGIHLYTRLDGRQTSDDASAFARELARLIEADHPDLVVSQMTKSLRPGKVFLDWSQNNGSKTTIAPYSLRGRPQPTVAAPRTWEELDDPDLRHVLLHEMLERADALGDLFAPLRPQSAEYGPLSAYLSKRAAGRTPEPVPDSPVAAPPPRPEELPRFVIQEHHASRLHWDLRLEHGGVLVSWAVPRGIPDSPERNHLAVMTEDHPLSYATFEGEIPRGEYGAGSMTIWDEGHYELEKWRDDEIILTATGRDGGPLGRARLALIRTEGEGEKSSWLLHRMKDAAASAARAHRPAAARTADPPHAEGETEETSARTDATSAPAASDASRVPDGSAPPSGSITLHGRGPAPMLAVPATAARGREAAERWGPWVEFKWDGIRAIGLWDGERLRLRARSGTDITARYPELTGLDAGLGPVPAVVDGEIVALDRAGRPSFTRLQNRMHLTKPREIAREAPRTPVTYFLFDVLGAGDADATSLPLADRRLLLEDLARDAIPTIVVPPVSDDVDSALQTAKDLNLEGVVVKDPRSRYRAGARSEEWLKVKLTRTQEVVIGGIRPGKGGRTGSIGSLLLGIPGPDGLRYAGRVGTGFTEAELARLQGMLEPLRTDENPFVGVPAADASDARWVRPRLVAEVEFAEFSPGDILRHARWRGLRSDIAPADVAREP